MTTNELKQYIRNGKYAWPGGYPIYFVAYDGEVFSYDTVREHYKNVLYAMKYLQGFSGWDIKRCEVNWEDDTLRCSHSGEPIECAYGED